MGKVHLALAFILGLSALSAPLRAEDFACDPSNQVFDEERGWHCPEVRCPDYLTKYDEERGWYCDNVFMLQIVRPEGISMVSVSQNPTAQLNWERCIAITRNLCDGDPFCVVDYADRHPMECFNNWNIY